MSIKNEIINSDTDFLFIKTATIYPPIAYIYLAPHIEKHGLKVAIIDRIVDSIGDGELKEIINQVKPKYVGIKCLSFAADKAIDTAKIVKASRPDCTVIFGGHHTNARPEDMLSRPYIDLIVRGEGEKTIDELIYALENNLPLDDISGIGFKKANRLIINKDREFIQNLDDLPLPAYHLLDMEKYFKFSRMHGIKVKNERFMPVFSSRGCPYKCIYCHHSEGLRFRSKSPERFFEEIKLLSSKYGIREFHIEDDTFNLNLKRAKRILDLISSLEHDVSLQFPNGIRADLIDEELAEKMKKAGTFMVCIAIETGNNRIMKLIEKNLDISKVEKSVNILVNKRILTWGFFMLGFPTEGREEMQQTVSFARKLRLHFASFSIVVPFPGTKLWTMIDTESISLEEYFSNLTNNSSDIEVSKVPAEEMPSIRRKAIKQFYSIWRMLRIATYITNVKDIKYYWSKFLLRKANK